MEKPRTARLLHQLLVLYQRVALYPEMLAETMISLYFSSSTFWLATSKLYKS